MSSAPVSVYLRSYLAPFAGLLERPDVTDIFVNRPGEIWLETIAGELERHDAPVLDETTLWRLARQIASLSHQGISREHPLLSATLPGGERVQIIAPPATREHLAIAVRKQVMADLRLTDYQAQGAFSDLQLDKGSDYRPVDQILSEMLEEGRFVDFLRLALQARKNIVIAGGTATGKTTFLNALLKEIPLSERLILIEDTAEIQMDHPNGLGLVAVRGTEGEAEITTDDLVQASLRMRPDRIILGELRGPEAASYLRAVNTGHPGSITTVHANSPHGAIDQLALLVLQSGINLGRAEIADYIRGIVDVYVQVARRHGRRVISEINFPKQHRRAR